MLITKFNRLIRNRVIWGCFAVIICVMFVGAFSPTKGGCGANKENSRSVGTLFGAPVTPEEYQTAHYYEMGMREKPGMTPEQAEELTLRTWKRLAALRAAEKMGITVSPEEIAEMLHRDPSFNSKDGAFDQQRYLTILQNLRMTPKIYESYLKQEKTLAKLAGILQSAVWTSPTELTQKLNNLTDSFVLEYLMLNHSNLVSKVKVSDEEVKAFFDDHKKYFEIPEKVSVKYVEWPISNYLAQAEIKDEDVHEYYDEHKEDLYTATDTNDMTKITPLDDVKDQISESLRREIAAFKAKDAATEFVIALTPDRDGHAVSIDELAASHNLPIHVSPLFALNEKLAALRVDQTFNKAAFDLDTNDITRSFSDPIIGSNAVYVIAVDQRMTARSPAFAEVSEIVTPIAKRFAEQKAFYDKAKEVRDSLRKAVDEGRAFSATAAEQKLKVSTTHPFTVYGGDSPTNEIANFDEMLPMIASMKKGEMTDAIETSNGVFMAYVKERTPGEPMAMETLRPQLVSTLDRYRGSVVFNDWCDYMLAKAGFTNTVSEASDEKSGETPSEPAANGHSADLL